MEEKPKDENLSSTGKRVNVLARRGKRIREKTKDIVDKLEKLREDCRAFLKSDAGEKGED